MNNKGFTLVEILIVVIILGILAAIVIPQFTEASNDARESALASDLQTVRSQVELFHVQHGDVYPGEDDNDFVSQLTSKTDYDGTVNASSGAYGPYLQKFPSNPFISGATADDVTTEGTAGSGSTGWFWNATTNQIKANDSTAHAAL